MKPRYIDIVIAEFKCFFTEFIRRKSLIIALILYPYILTALILFIGTIFGSPRYFREKIPADPLLFFLSSSLTLLVSLVMLDDIGARFIWEEQLGTLSYLMLMPASMTKFILASPIPRLVLTLGWVMLTLAPTAIYVKGVETGIAIIIVSSIAALGALSLMGFALIIGGLLILSKGEWAIYWIIRPLILFLSGVLYPVALMPLWLKVLSMTMPISYAVEASRMLIAYDNPEIKLILLNIGLILVLSILYTPIGLKTYKYLELKVKRVGGLK